MKILLITCSILSIFYFCVSHTSASSNSLDKTKEIKLKKLSLIDDNLNSLIDDEHKIKFCSYTQLWQLNDGYKLSQSFGILKNHLIFFKLAIIKEIKTPYSKSPQLHKWFLKKVFDTEISNKEIWYDLDYKSTKLSKGTFVLVESQFMRFIGFLLSHFPDLQDFKTSGTEATFSNKAVENNYYGMKGPFKIDINFNNGSKHDILELIPCINKMIKYFDKKYDLKGKDILVPDIEEMLRSSAEFHSRYKKVFKINHYSYQEESNKFILNRKGSFKNKKSRTKK